MLYVKAKLDDLQDDMVYRVYVTDALKTISENTAKFAGGSAMSKRYVEMIEDKNPKPQKSAEEVISETIEKAGLVVI